MCPASAWRSDAAATMAARLPLPGDDLAEPVGERLGEVSAVPAVYGLVDDSAVEVHSLFGDAATEQIKQLIGVFRLAFVRCGFVQTM